MPFQRAGDYVLAWSEELNTQSNKLFGGTAATKSTLVKRGAKGRAENAESAGDPPAKRVKVEAGAADMDDEIRRNYEKGTLAKVILSNLILSSLTLQYQWLTITKFTAYGAYTERFPQCAWPLSSREEDWSRRQSRAILWAEVLKPGLFMSFSWIMYDDWTILDYTSSAQMELLLKQL